MLKDKRGKSIDFPILDVPHLGGHVVDGGLLFGVGLLSVPQVGEKNFLGSGTVTLLFVQLCGLVLKIDHILDFSIWQHVRLNLQQTLKL